MNREICAIGAKTQVGKEEVRVKLKLFETCLMPALLYGMEAWKTFSKAEIQQLEKSQGKALRKIFSLPITAPYIELIIETGVWPAEQRINYRSLILYHNIINNSKDRLVKLNSTRTKSAKPPKHLLWENEDNSRRIKNKIRSSSNNEEI